MPWFKVDDHLAFNVKVLTAGNTAMGLWIRAGSWSAAQLSDGVVPGAIVAALGGSPADAAALVEVGLWDAVEGGWAFHDWAEYQPTKAEVLAARAKTRDRVAKHRASRASDHAGNDERHDVGNTVTPVDTADVSTHAPTRPIPTPSTDVEGGGPRKRAHRIPDDFAVTTAMQAWAAERTPLVDVNSATERFCNHWRAKAGRDATKLDWTATWRNWLIRDQDDRVNRQKLTPTQRAAAIVQAGREVQGRRITTLALGPGS